MNKVNKPVMHEVQVYFADQLGRAAKNQQLRTSELTLSYVTNLLVHFVHSQNFFTQDDDGKNKSQLLAELYGQYIQGDRLTQAATLQRLGDLSLMVSGFFSDSLKKKLVDIDYYFGMGGAAYWTLSEIQKPLFPEHNPFRELATKFRAFCSVLEEMSERSQLTSNSDVLRLYEKWLLTKSERIRKLLTEKGIAAVDSMGKQVQ